MVRVDSEVVDGLAGDGGAVALECALAHLQEDGDGVVVRFRAAQRQRPDESGAHWFMGDAPKIDVAVVVKNPDVARAFVPGDVYMMNIRPASESDLASLASPDDSESPRGAEDVAHAAAAHG